MTTPTDWRITTPEMATILGVSERTVRRYVADGDIPSVTGGAVLRAEFTAWLANGREAKSLTPEQIEEAAYRGTQRALTELQPVVRFEPATMRVIQPIKARRA